MTQQFQVSCSWRYLQQTPIFPLDTLCALSQKVHPQFCSLVCRKQREIVTLTIWVQYSQLKFQNSSFLLHKTQERDQDEQLYPYMTPEKDNVRSPATLDCQKWLSSNLLCRCNTVVRNQLIFSTMYAIFTDFGLTDT